MSYKTVNWNELFYTLTDVDKLNKSVKKKNFREDISLQCKKLEL